MSERAAKPGALEIKMTEPARIVCLGGGWSAIYFVAALKSAIRRGQVQVTVVSRDNFHTFHGFIGEMLVGRIQPFQIINPARRIFPGARFHNAEVEAIDVDKQTVTTSRKLDGRQYVLPYDYLYVSLGSIDDLSRYPGIAEHAHKLKTYWDCFKVRNHILAMLEMAEIEDDPAERRRLLTFVVVGGGYGGIEVAAELQDYVKQLAKKEYPLLHEDELRVMVLEGGSRILPELHQHHEPLVSYAERFLKKSGLEIKVNTRIVAATPEEAVLDGGERIPTRSIISSSGTALSPLLERLPYERDERGRLKTDRFARVVGSENIWAGGDCAAVPHPKGGTCPTVAIFAMRSGRLAARNIVRTLQKKPLQPFTFTGLGDACSLGRRRAVSQVWGLRFYGIFAWIIWRSLFLAFVPTWDRRIRIFLDWMLTPIFGRDIVNVRMDEPYGIRQELYEPGQAVVRQGEIGKRLYLIWKGEAEVIRRTSNGEEVIAVLGSGAHFGETAVFDDVRRTATVRAKTRLEVISLGQAEAVVLSDAVRPFGDIVRKVPAAPAQEAARP
jgi:NADH dehydrogenase